MVIHPAGRGATDPQSTDKIPVVVTVKSSVSQFPLPPALSEPILEGSSFRIVWSCGQRISLIRIYLLYPLDQSHPLLVVRGVVRTNPVIRSRGCVINIGAKNPPSEAKQQRSIFEILGSGQSERDTAPFSVFIHEFQFLFSRLACSCARFKDKARVWTSK